MGYMDVNLANYTGVREKKADSRKDKAAAEAQRAERAQTPEERKKTYEVIIGAKPPIRDWPSTTQNSWRLFSTI